jgi:hypothetical protein
MIPQKKQQKEEETKIEEEDVDILPPSQEIEAIIYIIFS